MKAKLYISIFLLLTSVALADFDRDALIGTELPDYVAALFGDEVANIHIETANGEIVYGLVTSDGVITEFRESALDDPTVNIYSDQQTIDDIQNSENPLLELQVALDEDRITYQAVGVMNRIRWGFSNLISRVASWFSGSSGTSNAIVIDQVISSSNDAEVAETEETTENSEDTSDENPRETNEGTDNSANEHAEPEDDSPKTHTVEMMESGFRPKEINIKSGDTVVWEVTRTGPFGKGLIIGVRNCRDIRSGVFTDSFEWTFNDVETCVIVDGIMTTKDSRVIVE